MKIRVSLTKVLSGLMFSGRPGMEITGTMSRSVALSRWQPCVGSHSTLGSTDLPSAAHLQHQGWEMPGRCLWVSIHPSDHHLLHVWTLSACLKCISKHLLLKVQIFLCISFGIKQANWQDAILGLEAGVSRSVPEVSSISVTRSKGLFGLMHPGCWHPSWYEQIQGNAIWGHNTL